MKIHFSRLLVLAILSLGVVSCSTNTPRLQSLGHEGRRFFRTVPTSTTSGVLILDQKLGGAKVQNYRRNPHLKISGSASFGPAAMKDFEKLMNQNVRGSKKDRGPLVVIDLCKEPHGLVNDNPATWVDEHNWVSAGLTYDQALQEERRLFHSLKVGQIIDAQEIKSIESEQSMLMGAGYSYLRWPIVDSVRPSDSDMDSFIAEVRKLPAKPWIHMSCRTGRGRTTLMMLLYDILLNAKSDKFDDIVKRNIELSQDPDLLLVGDDKNWRYPFQVELNEFVREFYNYASLHPRGEVQTWSDWVKR